MPRGTPGADGKAEKGTVAMTVGNRTRFARLGATFALVLVALGALLAPAADAGFTGATLTIHNRLCPRGYTGTNYYRDCHDRAAVGMEFTLAGAQRASGTTDSEGNVSFDLLSGAYRVRGGVPGDVATLRVYCSEANTSGGRTPYPFRYIRNGVRGPNDPSGIRIELGAGDNVICDWYNIPESQR